MADPPTAPPKAGKKRESLIGLVLTAAGCAVFLVWWFRPISETPPAQTPAQYVAEALQQSARNTPRDGWLMDLDLLEISVLQAGAGLDEQGVATAIQIKTPQVQARALRQIAQKVLGSDSRMGTAPQVCDHISDPVLREMMRDEVLLELARLGYADTVIPQANTPRLKAALAATLADSGEPEKAAAILAEARAATAVPPQDVPAWRENIALTQVHLILHERADLPAAIEAVRAVPPERQATLWEDLFRTVFGAGGEGAETARTVLDAIADPALRRRLEMESVRSLHPLRPGADFLAEAQAVVAKAGDPRAKAEALLELASVCVLVSPLTDATAELTRAAAALTDARPQIDQIQDAIIKATLLARLADSQAQVTLAGEAAATLDAALNLFAAMPSSTGKLELAAAITRQAFNAGLLEQTARAVRITEECLQGNAAASSRETIDTLVDYYTRSGDWNAAAGIAALPGIKADPEQLLAEMALLIGEQVMGLDPSGPPARSPELDRIRQLAMRDEPAAAGAARGAPAGAQRARALLAVAKGLLLPPGLPPNLAGTGAPPEEEINLPVLPEQPSLDDPPAAGKDQ